MNQKIFVNLEEFENLTISERVLRFAMQRNRAGLKFENSYQKPNVPREQQEEQHSNPSHDHAAKAAGKNA